MGKTIHKLILAGAAAGFAAACAAQDEDGMADAASQAENEACGAEEYAYLVGQSHAEAMAAQRSGEHRIYAEGDPVTMDYNPERLNIVLDEEGGTVVEVSCG